MEWRSHASLPPSPATWFGCLHPKIPSPSPPSHKVLLTSLLWFRRYLQTSKIMGKKTEKWQNPKIKTAPPTAQKLSCNVGHSIPDHPQHLHLKARPTKDEIDDEISIDLYRSLMFLNVFFREISEFLSVHHLLLPLELGPWPLKNFFANLFWFWEAYRLMLSTLFPMAIHEWWKLIELHHIKHVKHGMSFNQTVGIQQYIALNALGRKNSLLVVVVFDGICRHISELVNHPKNPDFQQNLSRNIQTKKAYNDHSCRINTVSK